MDVKGPRAMAPDLMCPEHVLGTSQRHIAFLHRLDIGSSRRGTTGVRIAGWTVRASNICCDGASQASWPEHSWSNGVTHGDIERMLRRRELTRVRPGVFVNHTGPLTPSQL